MNGDERGIPPFDPVDELKSMMPTWSPTPNTTYNLKQAEESQRKVVEERIQAITAHERKIKGLSKNLTLMDFMDIVEETVRVCGGEPKAEFREVSSELVRVFTRVPIDANLFTFLPPGGENTKFNKAVTKLLLNVPRVMGVRWIPEGRECHILVFISPPAVQHTLG